MAAPTYPGVYIQELTSPVHPITGVSTSIAAFVGYSARGIDNRAQQIFSYSDFERLYGGLASNSEVSYAVQQFFNNGGNQAYVVRAKRSGASAASVTFDGITFTALSSGTWANGQLLIDVDYNGILNVTATQSLPGTVDVDTAGTVTGTGTKFQTGVPSLAAGQYLVFGADPSQTPYQISTVGSDTNVSLEVDPPVALSGSSVSVLVNTDPTAFNLTVTNLVDGTVESFPGLSLNSNLSNFLINVVNDLDNGSQLVNVTSPSPWPNPLTSATVPPSTAPPAATGLLSGVLTMQSVLSALCSGAATVTITALSNGSNSISGTGFLASMVGSYVIFESDSSLTAYGIAAVTGTTSLTLTTPYKGATIAVNTTASVFSGKANEDYSISLSIAKLTTPPSPLPLTIKVFASGAPIPQSFSGLAAQLQQAINSALKVQMPGASVVCSSMGYGVLQSLRVLANIPQIPDAVLTIGTPAAGNDASAALGFTTPTQNVAHYALGTGNSTWGSESGSSPGSDGAGLPATTDLIGDPGANTGIYALNLPDIFFNLLSIPEATRAIPGNPSAQDPTVDPNSVFSAAVTLCDTKRAMLLIDCPPSVNTVAAAVDWKTSGLTVVDPNGAAFFPRLRLPDPLNNYQLRTFAPSGVVAGLYARTDTNRGVWKAPAGTEATLTGVQGFVYKLSDAEQGVLNPLGLNCFRNFPVYGSVLWGSRTLVGADAMANQWKYVPVRRLALFLEASLYQGTQWVVFEPNDEPLWSSIRLNIGSFMQNLFIQGYFQGQTPDQAYFVKCDSETTTQTDINNGVVNIVVGFAPLLPAEFVIIQIQQMSGQTSN